MVYDNYGRGFIKSLSKSREVKLLMMELGPVVVEIGLTRLSKD